MPPVTDKDKLIAAKEKWARERRGLTGAPPGPVKPRLPPGQRETFEFPVLDLGDQPNLATRDRDHHRHPLRHHMVAL